MRKEGKMRRKMSKGLFPHRHARPWVCQRGGKCSYFLWDYLRHRNHRRDGRTTKEDHQRRVQDRWQKLFGEEVAPWQ